MYCIGICDDEPIFLESIMRAMKEILDEMRIEYDIRLFHDTGEFTAYLGRSDASLDLLLLDILMEGQTGLELAKELRASNNPLPIIFITSTMDFALEGYTVEPLGYLLKPVRPDALKEAFLRAWNRRQSQRIVLNSPSRSISFHLSDVLYLEIYDKELHIHLTDGEVPRISVSLHAAMAKLPQQQFVQCHRSYLVSLPMVTSIWRYGIELKNHEKIPISKTYYNSVQDALLNWASLL